MHIIFFFPWIEVSWIESEPNRKLTLAKVSLRKLSEKTHHCTFGIKYDFEVQTDLALLKKYIFIEKNTFVMNICIDLGTISNILFTKCQKRSRFRPGWTSKSMR